MHARDFDLSGWSLFRPSLTPDTLTTLREGIFKAGEAGTRCLLDAPHVTAIAREVRTQLLHASVLETRAVAVQAIAFNKTPQANWKVTWHQDVMFPFAERVRSAGYDLATKKDGIDYARPPREVLEQMLAVRLHLDDCDGTNGPLRVSSGTHRAGILRSTEISDVVKQHGEMMCLARAGDALLIRPLVLHASSPAVAPKHRRVLHLVYSSGRPMAERWYREVGA